MILILTLIDWLLFIPLALCVAYLLVYAIASKFYRAPLYPEANKQHRIAVFFPAYKEDKVIIDSVRSFLGQDYPKELYDVYVISDHMQDSTNETLSQLPIRLLTATYEDSSKAKALLLAINAIEEEGKAGGLRDRQLALMYDIAVVMDADNVTVPGFLSEVNRAYCTGVWSMQAHRTGKNLNTDIALLDGVSEEINNGFFRSGHNALGLSAGLAGSGMAFHYFWYYNAVQELETAGEDKELELALLECGIHTVYLETCPSTTRKRRKKRTSRSNADAGWQRNSAFCARDCPSLNTSSRWKDGGDGGLLSILSTRLSNGCSLHAWCNWPLFSDSRCSPHWSTVRQRLNGGCCRQHRLPPCLSLFQPACSTVGY